MPWWWIKKKPEYPERGYLMPRPYETTEGYIKLNPCPPFVFGEYMNRHEMYDFLKDTTGVRPEIEDDSLYFMPTLESYLRYTKWFMDYCEAMDVKSQKEGSDCDERALLFVALAVHGVLAMEESVGAAVSIFKLSVRQRKMWGFVPAGGNHAPNCAGVRDGEDKRLVMTEAQSGTGMFYEEYDKNTGNTLYEIEK